MIQALIAAFLGILFLQSGLDKVTDWKGNLEWLTGHFSRTPMRGFVREMLGVITIIELGAGTFSALGVVAIVFFQNTWVAFMGAVLAGIAFTALFFGQRISKDYAGAASLVPYFFLSIAGLYFLSM